MKRYTELTKEEKITLSNDGFYEAVKLEAIQRGIAPPLTLPEALTKLEFRGFQIPPDAVTFFEIAVAGEYTSEKETGIAFKTAEEAQRACTGAISISRSYGSAPKLSKAEFAIRQVLVTLVPAMSFAAKLEAYKEETKEFDGVCEECREDWSAVLQSDYNARVNGEKKAQYLALAQGSEEIAKAFWSKAERAEWPTEEPAI